MPSCLTRVTPWSVARQAPLSMGFPRQGYWSGLPFPSPEDLPNPRIEPTSPALAGGLFTTEPPEESPDVSRVKVKLLSRVRLFATPWTLAHQAPPSMEFFLGKSTGVGCHFLLQGIFPTPGSNPGLLHCGQTLYRLSH